MFGILLIEKNNNKHKICNTYNLMYQKYEATSFDLQYKKYSIVGENNYINQIYLQNI